MGKGQSDRMVEIKNLTKYYGTHAAVKDISFTVGDREVLGFLGPNGAGKSTTMNMITGCLPSTDGTVTVDGFDIAKDGRIMLTSDSPSGRSWVLRDRQLVWIGIVVRKICEL